uniref:Protein transport protein SEC23 n=1 Tax=Calcidiscus leptoporus TaxID=127549 RepID=A0A7S0P3C0_9EUKA|mmetsp:Transcript_5658/g.13098  ORF Transcript_5658/g.13098 Transcript_5658/m.13098 type:complete len:761 (+) Transcript_5658:90-2372(+)|eukprot:CAMPEP_0119356480 /NCGR_PEP_ID=MMETSP1334-20130426/5070_1 /TAXON_ID=127549 /ORGANISM="Calcidiscus leptoporus, Strain RCC1130" /LENGTH=760 /DNA_ID=CAMNT_0007370521 /DNA_START=70 /DNA_END=2352 /DNA_ORIENTATION=+
MNFHEAELNDGVRFSWNVWPSSRLEATRMVVPLGCLYTPLRAIDNLPLLPYEPVVCKACPAVLNPYCRIDYKSKIWVCPFCFQRNHFPAHYNDISEQQLPAELIPNYTTIEYALPRAPAGPPVFMWVIDTCVDEAELRALKDSLEQVLQLLSSSAPNAMLGLITYGTVVQVHELGFEHCSKSYTFKGTKDVPPQQLADLLGIAHPSSRSRGAQPAEGRSAASRFVLPVTEAEFAISNVLAELKRDPWPVANDARSQRCTGVAASIAVSLLETAFPNMGARVMLFTGGPCTVGPGQMVGVELSETPRSHHDIEKETGNYKYMKKAQKHYAAVAKRAAAAGHVFDLFACALDQVGVAEMRALIEKCGGYCVMSESFTGNIFKQSFKAVFATDRTEQYLKMAFGGSVEVLSSNELKVCGAIGNCSSLGKKAANVAETEIGFGNTNMWSMGGMDDDTTIALYFEVTAQANAPAQQQGAQRFIQFQTSYQHSSGQYRLRVTTVAHSWANTSQLGDVARGFDQEAAAVLMARIASHKTQTEEAFDILRWIDRMLIRLVAKFADYRRDDAASFRLGTEFSIYPQFMFHLRRSQFLQTFGNSPDETTYARLVLARENTTNSLIMIQPTLLAYSFDGPPVPVLLDVTSISPERILLLDTFFHVIVFHGETISAWRKQGYHESTEHAHFRELLLAPKEDAAMLLQERFPVPLYVECDQFGSQARFLLAKLNPSVTHNSTQAPGQGSDFLFTDDVSLQVFMDHLKRLAVQS